MLCSTLVNTSLFFAVLSTLYLLLTLNYYYKYKSLSTGDNYLAWGSVRRYVKQILLAAYNNSSYELLSMNRVFFVERTHPDKINRLSTALNFSLVRHTTLNYWDIIIFKKIALNNVWGVYLGDEIDSLFFKILADTNIFYYGNNLPPFNFFIYKYTSVYYLSWTDYPFDIIQFYKYHPSFTAEQLSMYNLSTQIDSKLYKKLSLKLNNILVENLLIIIIGFKSLLLAAVFTLSLCIYLCLFFYINLLKQLALWVIIGFLFFWLISGFNFFLKRGQFGKLTSALSRFWKRTNMYFWLVEGFLFLLFFYYYLNSSQEPTYFYDYSSLNQSYLPNLHTIYLTTFLLVVTTLYYYFWTLNITNFTNQQNIAHVLVLTVVLVYFYVIESYQFYYILTIFFENLWVFSCDLNLWVLETESPRLRLKHQYLILALIAKYWHFIFIFLSWIFFILKIFEQKRSYYTHSGFNLQNLIILFWLNFLFILQWFKWAAKRFFDGIYYWFFTDSNFQSIWYFFTELSFIVTYVVGHRLFQTNSSLLQI